MFSLKKNSNGFTIVEVLIVLAIAGVIMMVVFLAVPALQRSQRNTARKNDVSRMAAALTSFLSNNNGVMPGGVAPIVAATATADENTIINDIGTFGQYSVVAGAATPGDGKFSMTDGVASGAALGTLTADRINVVRNAVCNGAGTTTTGASTRSMAITYTLETGTNAYQGYCLNAN